MNFYYYAIKKVLFLFQNVQLYSYGIKKNFKINKNLFKLKINVLKK